MGGTREGGLKAAATIKEELGKDFYSRIGKLGKMAAIANGGAARGGFAANAELASTAGRKGGQASRRGKKEAAPQ